MKYKKHYLSNDGNNKHCPINERTCDSWCAWFDHENQDCRMIGGFWKVREGINEVVEEIRDNGEPRTRT